MSPDLRSAIRHKTYYLTALLTAGRVVGFEASVDKLTSQ